MTRLLLRWPAQVVLTVVLVGSAVLASLAMFAGHRDAAHDEARSRT